MLLLRWRCEEFRLVHFEVLQRFFDREPLLHIAEDMGYTADYVKKKNKVCKAKLMELIQNDPRFGEIRQSTYE